MSDLTLMALVIGASFGTVFMVFMVMSFKGDHTRPGVRTVKNDSAVPRKLAAIVGLVLGSLLLLTWIYYFFEVSPALSVRSPTFNAHATTMLVAAVAIWLSSYALYRDWKRGPAYFIIAIGSLAFALIHAFSQYGLQGHIMFKSGIAVLTLIILVYFVGVLFAWEHFVLHMDDEDSANSK